MTPQCQVKGKIQGGWQVFKTVTDGETFERDVSVGTTTSKTSSQVKSFTDSFASKLSESLEVEGIGGVTVDSKTSLEISTTNSKTFSSTVTNQVSHNKVVTEKVTLKEPGVYWQFKVTASNENCGGNTQTEVLLPSLVRTTNANQRPCCLPGYFTSMTGDYFEKCVTGQPILYPSCPGYKA